MEDKKVDIDFIKQKLDDLRSKMVQYNYSYYVLNTPEISDKEYDELKKQLKDYEKLYDEKMAEKKLKKTDFESKEDRGKMVEKAIKLYQYLQHLVRLRTSIVLETGQYIDVIWLHEIPREEHCDCAVWDVAKEDDNRMWVEIKRPILPKVPQVPKECLKWVDLNTLENYQVEPTLRERIIKEAPQNSENQDGAVEYLELSNYPDVQIVWKNYLEKQWKVWAEKYGPVKKVQEIYSHLFNMYQQQKALGESYEVVIGLGLLSCKTKDGAQVYRHILYAQTELEFEPNKGTIIVKASPEGAKLQFETEMLDPSEQPPVEIQLNLEDRLKEISDEIWDKSLVQPVIKSWINSVNPKAVYDETIIPVQKDITLDYPIASFAPAIILRKRTNVGILRFIENVINQLRQNKEIPSSIKVFLSIEEPTQKTDYITDESEEKVKDSKIPEEIYFPLPFNEEQSKIIKEIGTRKGVLVQGPPGTGKSHTIANLISHFLAVGKRVLVTSQTARALKVLREKIPKQIQPLCVSILGNRQEDFDNLISAVSEITNKYYSWDKERNQKLIAKLELEVSTLKKISQEVKVSLRELREKEIYKYNIIDRKFNGTAQSIAQQLKETENHYGWIPDEIKSSDLPPLLNMEFKRLLELYRKFNDELCKELAFKRINPSDIFTPEEFVEMVENEQRCKEREDQIESDIHLRILYDKLKKTDAEKRKNLLNSLRTLEKAKTEACRRPLPWLKEAVYAILGDQDQPLKDLASMIKKYLQNLKDKALLADDCNISIPKEMDIFKIKADAGELLLHLESGKNLGWGIFRPKIYKTVKYLLRDIFVNGKVCNNIGCLKSLINFIDVKITIDKLREAWKNRIEIPHGTNFSQAAIISEQLEALEVVLAIEPVLVEAKQDIKEIDVISEPSWHEEIEINNLILVLEGTFIIDRMYEIEEKLNRVAVIFKALITNPNAHFVNKELLDSLESRNWSKWGEAYNKLISLEQDQKSLAEYTELMGRLKEKAPLLADSICDYYQDYILEKYSDYFEESWSWLRADAWLREFEETHDEYQLQRDYEDCENKSKKIIAELAAAKAWQNCFDVMTEEQRQHLMAWSKAIQRIGKGTGKRAEKHRRDAEAHMNECREAIPAWVMPLYRVAETIAPKPEIFDVVIIDEASQSGPEALFLLYIAKKCIVVGDNQQISPEGVGIERQDVDLLIERFLKDFPHTDSYGLESSLFDHAQIRYGSRIVLREHFRCVPEIIQFSNDLCYIPLGASLIPIRSYSPQRLKPICVEYVQGGYREGSGQNVINKPEAEVLVKQIAECCKDLVYKNKTMGVISLQGYTQARHIERLLVESIGPEEMEKRNLICGDAYDFQGDERDIIFLSLVAATNERIGPLVKETDKRRFNVASSRARDQIWLFHSVTLNDLNPNDYRYKLLSYFQNPLALHLSLENFNIEELRKIAKTDFRDKVSPPEPFDSWFEVDVFLKVVDHGYRAIPQFRIAEKRIDIVIEGVNKRLAIECDGDAWHGPEQYENDQWRQRMLERAGWKFWRIRGSTFYRDPEHTLDPLWQILEEMNIHSRYQPVESIKVEEKPPDLHKEVIAVLNEEKEISSIEEIPSGSDRLSAVLEYDKKMSIERLKKLKYDEIKKEVINLLQEGSQGKDLIADKVLRNLGFTCRGRNRSKLRNKVLRVVTDLRRLGMIQEYETDARKRIRLIKDQESTLFEQ